MTRSRPSPLQSSSKPFPDAGPLAGRERASALVDGELSDTDLTAAMRDWAGDEGLRRDCHDYRLIGDVLRSDQLACDRPSLLPGLRERLASEPRPYWAVPRERPARRWLMPAAAAAGFVAVGFVVLSLRPAADGGWSASTVAVSGPASGLQRSVAAPASAPLIFGPVDGSVIRDARLDAYFEAHRGAAGAMPSAVPGGALRSVDLLVPQR